MPQANGARITGCSWLRCQKPLPDLLPFALKPQHGVYVARHVGILLTGNVERFLDRPLVYRAARWPADVTAVVGSGLKGPKSLAARHAARKRGLPYLALEDGFLRSVELGDKAPPLSLLLDDQGIYYDARGPSRLEALIAAPHSVGRRERAQALQATWCAGRLSKYNHAREAPPPLAGEFVPAVDQTAGDSSIEYGLVSAASFIRMLEAALDEHPGLPVVLKVHPDVIAGRKKAHFDALTAGVAARVVLLAAPARRRSEAQVTLADLTAAALIDYPRYLDPETLQRCEPERLVERMSLQRRMHERFAPRMQAIGFTSGSGRSRAPSLAAARSSSSSADSRGAGPAARGLGAACRGRKQRGRAGAHRERLSASADHERRPGAPGFLGDRQPRHALRRQRTLGPRSAAAHAEFGSALRARAAALREAMVAAGLSSEQTTLRRWQRSPGALQPRVAEGGTRALPEAWIVYCPPPGVRAGPRPGSRRDHELRRWCNEIAGDLPIALLNGQVDAVHVLGSLTGFEALLHGLPVTCHGSPFYAGWGLTEDVHAHPRRTRRLALDELVAGALILYPSYLSRSSGAFTTPERLSTN